MEKSIINRRGEYLVVVDVAGTPRDKYSHPAGTWECAMTAADGSPQIIRGAYADGPVMQSIRPDEQAQWAVVGSVSDDKFINILKLLATSKTNAAALMGSAKSPKKAASSRENGKKGGRPVEKKTYWILSGEGENGTWEKHTATLTGIKRIATKERCGGDRWAQIWEEIPETDTTEAHICNIDDGDMRDIPDEE